MKLSKIIEEIEVVEIIGKTDIEISEIVIDSKLVVKNSLFVCLSGQKFDGHDYVGQAERYGAKAVVVEKKIQTNLTQIIVKNCRKVLPLLCSAFYERCDKKLKLIGVTGTNGKTTTSHLIYQTLKYSGKKCGVIGTIGIYYNDKFIEANLTTPDPPELFKILYDMYNDGIEIVVMEVSAHAIFLEKVYGMNFKIGVFTNLSLDHLDFFDNIEKYKESKLKFFKNNFCEFIVTNSDDETGREIISLNNKTISYGLDNPADVFAIDLATDKSGTQFIINLFDYVYQLKINLIGEYNVYNALASSACGIILGIKPQKIMSALEKVKPISGRLEKIYDEKFTVYVDYAHTPDGLEKSLIILKDITNRNLICVFGCGGNRDKSKREIMGNISGKYSDFTIITSDNPRYEEPMEIITEIEKGVIKSGGNYLIIQDRFEAIEYALSHAKKGDVILIAGKGCEKYQEVFGIKKLFNDKDTVMEIIYGEKG